MATFANKVMSICGPIPCTRFDLYGMFALHPIVSTWPKLAAWHARVWRTSGPARGATTFNLPFFRGSVLKVQLDDIAKASLVVTAVVSITKSKHKT